MKRLNFLLDEQVNSDQSLEVDVMRFVAIIGLIFWIIFAMVKSIPFMNVQKKPFEPVPELALPEPQINQKIEVSKLEPSPQKDFKSPSEQTQKLELSLNQARRQGLHLQFKSMEDLLAMLKNKKAIIYCRATNDGFDLFFEGNLVNGSFIFKNISKIPAEMWELKKGSDRDYFIKELSRTIPSTSTFSILKVMVFFSDTGFDSKVETMLARLALQKKSGIVSVSASGRIEFQEFAPDNDLNKLP